MKYFYAISALALATLLAGCAHSKEEAVVPPCDCPALPVQANGVGPWYTGPALTYDLPCFNPNNQREIVYYKGETNNLTNYGLYTANLDTHQQHFIHLGNDFYMQVRWGSTGWLALSKNNQVWKMKANGDSLTQLTFGTPHYMPQWSPDGQRIVCREPDTRGAPLVIFDKNGRRLAQLNGFPVNYCESWSPDGTKLLIIYGPLANDQGYGVGVYDLATNHAELLVDTQVPNNSSGNLTGAVWLPDSRNVVWAAGTGIYTTDTQTRVTKQLHTGCDTRLYLRPDVSADGRTILVCRVDSKSLDNGQGVYVESNLWLMDIDGSNERKLVL